MTDNELNAVLPGIQLAAFEVLWPVFPGLNQILIRPVADGCEVFCEFKISPPPGDRSDCERLVGEILAVAFEGQRLENVFSYGTSEPTDPAYQPVMSEKLFTSIAGEVAPWRLNASR